MFVPVEGAWRTYDAPVGVAAIVKYGAASGTAAHKVNGLSGAKQGWGDWLDLFSCGNTFGQASKVDLFEGVLIPANDNRGSVEINEEDRRLRAGFLQEVVFDREVDVGVADFGMVYLDRPLEVTLPTG